jgi:cysteine synthase A
VDILRAIGNTSMVRLRKVVPPNCADIFVKLEWENPTGSMKDRMAEATMVEYTGGSTGTSLALLCAVKGYRIKIVRSWITWRRWARS